MVFKFFVLLKIFTSHFLINALSTVLCWMFIPEKASDQKRVEANKTPASQARQSRSFIHDIEWSIFWDVFLIRFFLSFSSLVYRSNFSLLIKENFGASPKVIGYLISFQVRILMIVSWICWWTPVLQKGSLRSYWFISQLHFCFILNKNYIQHQVVFYGSFLIMFLIIIEDSSVNNVLSLPGNYKCDSRLLNGPGVQIISELFSGIVP